MERIVIEVDDRLARAWRSASDKTKKNIGNKINLSLAKELMRPSAKQSNKSVRKYLDFLDEMRDEMLSKGLSQEELDEILIDE